jgi:hypothetical protein
LVFVYSSESEVRTVLIIPKWEPAAVNRKKTENVLLFKFETYRKLEEIEHESKTLSTAEPNNESLTF